MGGKLYKYAGPDVLSKEFAYSGLCSFKCSYPKDFNDPYELFLTIDYNQDPDILAFYDEVIGQIPQLPTTCFSKSPEIVPMWAHYGHNHKGVVIEVDEEKIKDAFKKVTIEDVKYREEPDAEILELLHRANVIGKARYIYLLQNAVFWAAYFTKSKSWDYEVERRLIVRPDDVVGNEILLFQIPIDFVSALIIGSKAPEAVKGDILKLSEEIGCDFYELRISKNNIKPYFVDSEGKTAIFSDTGFSKQANSCTRCSEPIPEDQKICPWCSIQDQHRKDAAGRNIFRAYDRLGLLDEYLEEADKVGRKDGAE